MFTAPHNICVHCFILSLLVVPKVRTLLKDNLVVAPTLKPTYFLRRILLVIHHHIRIVTHISQGVDAVQILLHSGVEIGQDIDHTDVALPAEVVCEILELALKVIFGAVSHR